MGMVINKGWDMLNSRNFVGFTGENVQSQVDWKSWTHKWAVRGRWWRLLIKRALWMYTSCNNHLNDKGKCRQFVCFPSFILLTKKGWRFPPPLIKEGDRTYHCPQEEKTWDHLPISWNAVNSIITQSLFTGWIRPLITETTTCSKMSDISPVNL